MATSSKKLQPSRSKTMDSLKVSENTDPNIPMSPPLSSRKQAKSSANRSAQSKKVDTKTPGRIVVPRIRPEKERKFIIDRKSSRGAWNGFDFGECRKEAYETLRASQEEFFLKKIPIEAHSAAVPAKGEAVGLADGANVAEKIFGSKVQDPEAGSEVMKIESLVKEARNGYPSQVDDEVEKSVCRNLSGSSWALPGLQQSAKNDEVDASSTSVFSSEEFFSSSGVASELGLYDSVESNGCKLSWGNRTSVGRGRNKRSSSRLRGSWNKMLRVTSQQPFKLRTENSSNSSPLMSTKPETSITKNKDAAMKEEPYGKVAVQDTIISAFMDEVSNLVKFVDSKDIAEFHLKKGCELLIRKKEALPQPPVATSSMMAYLQAQLPPQPLVPFSVSPPAQTNAVAAAPIRPLALPPPSSVGNKSSAPPLKCHMAGTFYRSPAPGEPPFVKVGDKVQKGQVVCIIEAMKLKNEIEAEQSGTVVEIIVEGGKPVSVDTPLLIIQP